MNRFWRNSLVLGLFLIAAPAMGRLTLQNSFIGVSDKVLKNVELRLAIQQSWARRKLTLVAIKKLYQEAPREILAAVRPFGYFRAKVNGQLSNKGDAWVATYTISLGKPLYVTSMQVNLVGQATQDPVFQKLLTKLPLKQGDQFNAENYSKTKELLFNLAGSRGYLKAVMDSSKIYIDTKQYTCHIKMRFYSGPRYYFGMTSFTKTPFNIKFLERFLAYKPGEHYSNKKLQQTQEHFDGSDLFANVIMDPWPNRAKNLRVPIKVHMTPRKSREYTLGAGFGTDTGVRGLLGVTLRNFNSNGHRFTGVLKASQKQSNFETHYIIPGLHPGTDRYDISAASQFIDNSSGDSRTIKVGAAYITVLRGWQQTLQINLQHEWFRLPGQDWQRSTLLLPNATWAKSVSNDLIRPTKGYRLEFMTQGAVRKVASNISFLQAKIQAKTIRPIGKRLLLVLRGTLGYTAIADKERPNLPLTLRFTAGGAQSVRGYGYQDIGPATQMAVASAELRFMVVKHWYLATFFDAGNVSEDLFSHYHQGAGVGIVWLSPIGAIALSYALAIDLPHMPWRLQFSMGPEL